jgi:3-deoxy-7-phosphoheptulonate synthase
VSRGTERTLIGASATSALEPEMFDPMPGVEKSMHIVKQYKMVAREWHKANTVIDVAGIQSGNTVQVIARPMLGGDHLPQMEAAAAGAKAGGALDARRRVQARTSPYAFRERRRRARNAASPPTLTGCRSSPRLMDVRMLETFLQYDVDIHQIGTRNMQNFDLLKEVGRIKKPVILKRGMSATINEWLMAAEYIAAGGNHNIIFCERGIRTFETAYRNVLDVTAIPVLKRETHLPVIVDPSHAGGKAWMVPALSSAAVAAGADGLLIEIHPNPCEALCDADQALTPAEFATLMGQLRAIARRSDATSKEPVAREHARSAISGFCAFASTNSPWARSRVLNPPPSRRSGTVLGIAGSFKPSMKTGVPAYCIQLPP